MPGQEQYILNYIIGNEHQVIPLNCKEFYTFNLAGLFCENLKNPEYLLNIHLALSDPFCFLYMYGCSFGILISVVLFSAARNSKVANCNLQGVV